MLDKVRETVRDVLKSYGISKEEQSEETEAPPVEVSELILLTHPVCPHCMTLKQKIHYAIEQGWIREVNIESEEGTEIAKKLEIFEIPTLVAKLADGSYAKCKYWFEGDDFVFDIDYSSLKKK